MDTPTSASNQASSEHFRINEVCEPAGRDLLRTLQDMDAVNFKKEAQPPDIAALNEIETLLMQ